MLATNHCQTSQMALVPAVGQMGDGNIRAAHHNPLTYASPYSSAVTCFAAVGNLAVFLKVNLKYPFAFCPAFKILCHSGPLLCHRYTHR